MKRLEIVTLVFLFLSLFSCKKRDPYFLDLSKTRIEIDKDGGVDKVSVNSNEKEWTASCGAEWIRLREDGNDLEIVVAPNTTAEVRSVKVLVVSGITRTIEVQQQAGNAVITPGTDKIASPWYENEMILDVASNVSRWEAECDASWLKLTSKKYKNQVVLNFEENRQMAERNTVILLTDQVNNKVYQIDVNQAAFPRFILPMLKYEASVFDVRKFEAARHHQDNVSVGERLSFSVRSHVFDQLYYIFEQGVCIQSVLIAKSQKLLLQERKNLEAFLETSGFKLLTPNTYLNEEVSCTATIKDQENYARVQFDFIPRQPQSYPTFSPFPYGIVDFHKTKAEIETFEKGNKGTKSDKRSKLYSSDGLYFSFFEIGDNTDSFVYRSYWTWEKESYPKHMIEKCYYFKTMEKALFLYNGKTTPTKEFAELMRKEGFSYSIHTSNKVQYHRYTNLAKNLVIDVQWLKFDDMPEPYLVMYFTLKNEVGYMPQMKMRRPACMVYEAYNPLKK